MVRSAVALRSFLLFSSILAPVAAYAQPAQPADTQPADIQPAETQPSDEQSGDIIVTATRRSVSIQDVPFNIAAVGAEQIDEQRSFNLREVARFVPGVYIVDNGARSGAPIVFRGLNADPLGSFDGDASGGGTVATYVGEIPLYVDFRLHDVERVEFLLGPQGTLYGAGTMGGAIRYIPNRPNFDTPSAEVRADIYAIRGAGEASTDTGMTINLPVNSWIALRGSIDFLNDSGFIDTPYVVRQIGVSDPDPDFTNPAAVAANTTPVRNVNFEETVTARAALRVRPVDWLDVNFAYTLQDQRVGGRQISSTRVDTLPVPVGEYESLARVREPNTRRTQLYSIEAVADLGFAQLTSATGWSELTDDGQRDQTDLLIGLEYSYEQFPSFTAFTREVASIRTLTQELRLVSQHGGPISWIIGGFYNNSRSDSTSSEFTPGYDRFAVDNFGGIQLRPDSLEYLSVADQELTEMAGYGELSWQITPAWQVTVGGRYYKYELNTLSAVDLPLLQTVFNGRDPNSIELDFESGGQEDDGFLFKVNTSYRISPDTLAYATVSEGYRIGNSNGVPLCPTPLPGGQIVCALPDEFLYGPDRTLNFELGLRAQLFDRRLTLNAAAYYIRWSDPQVSSATQNGLQPITINGEGAETKGFEISAALNLGRFSARASYAYTDPQLTDTTLNLIPFITPPGFQSTLQYANGEPGDRLPGSPQHTGSVFASYWVPVGADARLAFNYSATAQSDVLQTVGARGNSTTLPGFSIHNVSARLTFGGWTGEVYVDNVFDQFADVGVRGSEARNQVVADANGDPVYVRTFGTYVLPPRTIGVRVIRRF